MLTKLDPILHLEAQGEGNKNRKLLYNILAKMFLTLCDNYSEKSDIYFSWFLEKLKETHSIFLEVLLKNG